MKTLFLLTTVLITTTLLAKETSLMGKVSSVEGCSNQVMVWLSLDKDNYKERLLLMHTMVPVGGKFKFYVKPGSYQVRASDEKGCEYFKRVTASNGELDVSFQMVKK